MFQKEQAIFNLLFEAVSEGVIVVDSKQKIVTANTSAEEMFGYNKGTLTGQSLNILIPKNYHPKHDEHVKDFMRERERRQMGHGRDIFGKRSDGTIFPVEAGLNPFSLDDQHYVMALVIDISVRKEHQLQITELNTHLEQKVNERTKELNEVVDKLKLTNAELELENKKRIKAERKAQTALKREQELNELKTKFLSLVSHEFKTPLSGILTSALLLGKYQLDHQQDKRNKHITTITEKVHYLDNILNDFLSVEKLETGKINYRYANFKLSKVINEVVYNSNMLLKEGQHIKYPENIDTLSLTQDEKIIELVLSNVVHNAIKYSPENSTIKLMVNQGEFDTEIIVADNGIGIPKEEQKNIFNRYFRAENAINIQGTGIGLNIAKSHLENLGGSISFSSNENVGTTFKITIPNTEK